MESSYPNINLHPEVQSLLFQHYEPLRRIFCDVLGHLEIDYLSIALVNPDNEMFFFSSRRSIEQNLIINKLWQNDPIFQPDFFEVNKVGLWRDMYCKKSHNSLRHYKLEHPGFSQGISIPSFFEEYRVIYSFALCSSDKKTLANFMNKIEKLTYLGRYSLQKILKAIPLPKKQCVSKKRNPFLKLVINNEVYHGSNT